MMTYRMELKRMHKELKILKQWLVDNSEELTNLDVDEINKKFDVYYKSLNLHIKL